MTHIASNFPDCRRIRPVPLLLQHVATEKNLAQRGSVAARSRTGILRYENRHVQACDKGHATRSTVHCNKCDALQATRDRALARTVVHHEREDV